MPTEDLAFGRNQTVGFAIEGTAGVYAPADFNQAWGTPTLKGIGFLEVAPTPHKEHILAPHMSGRPETTNMDFDEGIKNPTFRLKMKCPKENLAWFFLGFFGKVVTSGASPQYTHAFTPSLSPGFPPSFKIEYRNPYSTYFHRLQFRGAKVKSILLELTMENVILTMEFTAASCERSASIGTVPAILEPTAVRPFWRFSDLVNTVAGTYLSDIAESNKIIGFSSILLNFENTFAEEIEDSFEGGSNERIRLERAADAECIKLTATLKRLLKDESPYDRWELLGSEAFLQIKLFSDGPTTDWSFLLRSMGKLLEPPSSEARGLGLIMETIILQSIYHITMSQGMSCEIKDSQATPATQGS